MNQVQRNFLIKKITDSVEIRKRLIRESKPEPPSLSIYILHAVMSGDFEIISQDEIKELLRKKALNSKEREDWAGNSWHTANKGGLHFTLKEFFKIPEEYTRLYDQWRQTTEKMESEYAQLVRQSDGLITRIQLASDKTLQKMINEVDDMGDLSLMDTKLKLLN